MDSEVFVANLRGLLASRGLTQKDLADRIGGESEAERHSYYRWLRRTCSQGLTRCEDRNREQLQRIGDFFGIHPVERLWSRSLSTTQKSADELADMLRYIIQTTTPLDGIGRAFSSLVDADRLEAQIRKGYAVLLADRQLQARFSSKNVKRRSVRLENLPETTTTAPRNITSPVESPNEGESREDYLLRRTVETLRDRAQTNPDGTAVRMLRLWDRKLNDIIREIIRKEVDESLSFHDAWERYIKPNLIRANKSLEEDGDDEN